MSEDTVGSTDQKLSEKLGHRIKFLRHKAGLSQEDLAFAISSTQPHVAKVEKGEVNAGSDMLQRIAEALKVDISQLFALRADLPPEMLRAELEKMLDTANEEQLRLIFRIVDAIIY